MDYIREAIEYLRNYNNLVIAKMNLQDEINKLNAEIEGRAIAYKDMPGGSNIDAEDVLINKIFRRDRAEIELKETINAIEGIEKTLNNFAKDNEKYEKILREWLVNGNPLDYVAEQLGISERHIYREKERALKKFAIQLFGIKVIK